MTNDFADYLNSLSDYAASAYYQSEDPEVKRLAEELIDWCEEVADEMQGMKLSKVFKAKSAEHTKIAVNRFLALKTDLLPRLSNAQEGGNIPAPKEPHYRIPRLSEVHDQTLSTPLERLSVPYLTDAEHKHLSAPEESTFIPHLYKKVTPKPIRLGKRRYIVPERPSFALERTLSGYRENYIEPPKQLSEAHYEPVRADIEQPLLTSLVRAKRKAWGGVPRVLTGSEGEHILYERRYVHRRINTVIKGLVSECEQSWSAETLRRMLSHTLLKPVLTSFETVTTATVTGLEDSYTESLKTEIQRQVSGSPAKIDAWDAYGRDAMMIKMVLPDSALAELGLLADPKTAPKCTFKEVKKAFMQIENTANQAISEAWAEYHEKAALERQKEIFKDKGGTTAGGWMTAEEIDNLPDADLSFMDPDY